MLVLRNPIRRNPVPASLLFWGLAAAAVAAAGTGVVLVAKARRKDEGDELIFDSSGSPVTDPTASQWAYQFDVIQTGTISNWIAKVTTPSFEQISLSPVRDPLTAATLAESYIRARGGIPIYVTGPRVRFSKKVVGAIPGVPALPGTGITKTIVESDEPQDCIFYSGQFLCGGKKVEVSPESTPTTKSINVLPDKWPRGSGWMLVTFGRKSPKPWYVHNGWIYRVYVEHAALGWRWAVIGSPDGISGALPPASGHTASHWFLSRNGAIKGAKNAIKFYQSTAERSRVGL